MSDTVVDSSVVAKWILPEPDSAQAERLIAEVALKGERLIVLDLVFVEVTNAIWRRFHRRFASDHRLLQLMDRFLQHLDSPFESCFGHWSFSSFSF